jgi:hypothetical protein
MYHLTLQVDRTGEFRGKRANAFDYDGVTRDFCHVFDVDASIVSRQTSHFDFERERGVVRQLDTHLGDACPSSDFPTGKSTVL